MSIIGEVLETVFERSPSPVEVLQYRDDPFETRWSDVSEAIAIALHQLDDIVIEPTVSTLQADLPAQAVHPISVEENAANKLPQHDIQPHNEEVMDIDAKRAAVDAAIAAHPPVEVKSDFPEAA